MSVFKSLKARLRCHPVEVWGIACAALILINAGKLMLFRELLTDDSMSGLSLLAHTSEAAAYDVVLCWLIFVTGCRPLLLFLYGLQLLYLVANLLYYQFFGYYLYLDEIHRLLPSVFSILHAGAFQFDGWSLVFLADLPLVLTMTMVGKWPRWQELRLARGVRVGAIAMVPLLSVYWCWGVMGACESPFDSTDKLAEQRCVREHGLLAFTINDYFAGNRSLRHSHLHVSHKTVHFPPGKLIRNIYLIQVEAMDARIVGCKYQDQEVMPFLSKLRTESIYYPFTFSYHSGGGTSDCDFTVLNSVEPLRNESVFFDGQYDYPNAVAKVLRGSGYGVYAFHGNTIKCWSRNLAYPKMGYSEFFDIARMGLAEQGWGAPDEEVFNFGAHYTANCKTPYFAHFITMSSHYSYTSVEHYHHSAFEKLPGDPLGRRYLNSMNYVDGCLEKLVTELRRRNDGYIIILGDHTPPRLNSPYLRASKLPMNGAVLEFVPLFILGPGLQPRQETRMVASFLDVAPTILSLSGVPCVYASAGIDLSVPPPASPPPINSDNRAYSRLKLFDLCRTALP